MATIETISIDVEEESTVPTFCKSVGLVGVGLYLLALAIAGVQLYIAAEYTYYFQDLNREGVWVFFALASLFVTDLPFANAAKRLEQLYNVVGGTVLGKNARVHIGWKMYLWHL